MLQFHAGGAKAANDALIRHAAQEWGRYGIRTVGYALCNMQSVCLQLINTVIQLEFAHIFTESHQALLGIHKLRFNLFSFIYRQIPP